MGLEAACICTRGDAAAQVKALLESGELILRGAMGGRIAFTAMADVRAEAGELRFAAGADAYALQLGQDRAVTWARKILAPPPSLAEKLGIGPAAAAQVIGLITDEALAAAVAGKVGAGAVLSVAMVTNDAMLRSAAATHAATLPRAHLWVVHAKGPKAAFGDSAVRAMMREAGYMDNKVAAVSHGWTATRYTAV